jgi:exopolyphosphatase/guanosine-5'-triphosphate,3'-diphosphate pyrophosphatase
MTRFTVIFKEKIPVKLGEGGINNQVISHSPFLRGIKAMNTHKATIDRFEVDKILAFATSAIRSAKNGKEFVRKVKAETGIAIEVISGDREAELIYYGVRKALDMGKEKCLIMDIGGGSTEFIIANDEEIFWKRSYKLGAARLLEKFEGPEPITTESLMAIESYLTDELKTLTKAIQKFKVHELIGSSGSFDTFAEMICHQFYTTDLLEGKTSFEYRINDLIDIHQQLLNSTREQRLKMKGLLAMRVDMIVIASIFSNYIIQKYDIKKVRLSTYSLKEGVLYKMIQK